MDRKAEKTKSFLRKGIRILVILLTILAGVKAIFVSLDIDESYAVAQAYRLARGDRLLVDMWEPHQFSAFLAALLIKPYCMLTHTTEYLVIYLRIMGILIHTALGIWLYRVVKRQFGESLGFWAFVLHLNFLPKWVQMPEFEVMHYWFLLAMFLLLVQYFKSPKGKWQYPFLAGICLVGTMMSYPTMILLYPVYVLGMCMLERSRHGRKGKQVGSSSLFLTLGALASGGGFLVYLFSYQSLSAFRQNLSYIFLDESHTTNSQAVKWSFYGQQLLENLRTYGWYLLCTVVGAGILFLISRMIPAGKKEQCNREQIGKRMEEICVILLLLVAIEMQIAQMMGCLFGDENQFYMQFRYVAILLPALYLGFRYRGKMAELLWLGVLPGIVSLIAALFVTNMSLDITYSRTFMGVLCGLLIMGIYGQGKRTWIRAAQGLLWITLLGTFFVCRLVLIRVTGCLPVTVHAPLEKMTAGPARGIYVLQSEAVVWNENMKVLQEQIRPGDKVLYIGAENLAYLATDCIVAAPSTQGTAVYNEMYLYYYREHPERLPDVIVIDKTFATRESYQYLESNQVIFDWIAEEYGEAHVWESDFLKVMRKEDGWG